MGQDDLSYFGFYLLLLFILATPQKKQKKIKQSLFVPLRFHNIYLDDVREGKVFYEIMKCFNWGLPSRGVFLSPDCYGRGDFSESLSKFSLFNYTCEYKGG